MRNKNCRNQAIKFLIQAMFFPVYTHIFILNWYFISATSKIGKQSNVKLLK